jgi:hypothetical protein
MPRLDPPFIGQSLLHPYVNNAGYRSRVVDYSRHGSALSKYSMSRYFQMRWLPCVAQIKAQVPETDVEFFTELGKVFDKYPEESKVPRGESEVFDQYVAASGAKTEHSVDEDLKC